MYDERGSVWRKWDLQVQPIKQEWFDDIEDNEEAIEAAATSYLEEAEAKEIDVIAITDHNSGAAIDSIVENDSDVNVLAGVELDLQEGWHLLVILNPKYKEKIGVATWEGTINDFLSNICGIQRPFHNEGGVAKKVQVTTKDLIKQVFIEEIGIPVFAHCCAGDGFFQRGNRQSRKEILELFQENEARFVFEIKDDFAQIEYIRTQIENLVDEDLEIPIISSSDAHQGQDVGSCFTWIKADPSYEGLRQITIESDERVSIKKPNKLDVVNENKTNFISRVNFQKKENSNDEDVWFENLPQINLNHGLVAVIGNKGTGKSAFTDILSLVGKTTNYDKFSFLSRDKFRNPQNNKSLHYEASLEWEDGSIDGPIDLSENPDSHEYEKVKYLPQNFIEDLCNPVTKEETEQFEKELKEVIFSWVPENERLNQSSLDGIIKYKSEVTEEKIRDLREKINQVNKKILKLENKLTDEYRKTIEEKLEKKQIELKSHVENKPKEIKEPEKELEEDSDLKEINDKFRKLKRKISELNSRKSKYESIVKKINDRIAAADRLTDRIGLISKYIQDIEIKSYEDLNLLNLDFDELINFKENLEPITNKKAKLIKVKKNIRNHLYDEPNETESSLSKRIEELSGKKEALENKLDEHNQAYQEYLTEYEKWEEKKEKIIGAEDELNSKKYYEKELERIDGYPETKKELDHKREDLIRKIHKNYIDLKSLYSDLYEPVYNFIESHKELLEDFKLSFDVSIESKRFKEDFLNKIHQGRKGTFQGEEEGFKNLTTIHDSVDFNEVEELIEFLESMDTALHTIKRTNEKTEIKNQLVDDESPISLYNYLYGLEYLDPTYKLKLDGKSLNQLSPGERGILLLIFYLLISRDNRPLIIDQPEENLDNETVFKVLVKCIREAKKRRQVMIVTHNPNLAVVCDAEQIIIADIAKKKNNEVTYTCGAIENPIINQEILNILEGTRPAFDNRDAKYLA